MPENIAKIAAGGLGSNGLGQQTAESRQKRCGCFVAELQLPALIGVAPMNRDSGNQRGQRHVIGGRQSMRNILYMATLTARRLKPQIKAMALRLTTPASRSK